MKCPVCKKGLLESQDVIENLKQTTAWINSHPQKNTILSYMMNWKA